MNYQVCVTRFKEDVSWLLPIKENVIIMNKGEDNIPNQFRQVKIKNWGQEEYGYLRYIVERYSELPDVILFLQGRMDDHLDIYPGKKFDNPLDLVACMVEETFKNGHTTNHFQHKFGFNSAHYGFKLANTYPHMADSGYVLGQWFEKYIMKPFPKEPTWFQSCLFGVNRDFIRSRPKSYWKWLYEEYPKQNNTEVGHYYERSLYYVVNLDEAR